MCVLIHYNINIQQNKKDHIYRRHCHSRLCGSDEDTIRISRALYYHLNLLKLIPEVENRSQEFKIYSYNTHSSQ